MIRRLASAMFTEATRVAGKAAGMMLQDPRGQDAVARAVGATQRGKQLLDEVQEKALHAVGLAARKDHRELRKQIARIKRKARELGERIEEQQARGGAVGSGEGHGSGAGASAEERAGRPPSR
jgi:hypothetical protein